MTIFVDTSALPAVLYADDDNHAPAKNVWGQKIYEDAPLECANYNRVGIFALMQRRLDTAFAFDHRFPELGFETIP
jgi:predicted nucleic acid-binding protein